MKNFILLLIAANLAFLAYSFLRKPAQEDYVVFRGERGVPLLVRVEELERPPAVTSRVPIDLVGNGTTKPDRIASEPSIAVASSDKAEPSIPGDNAVGGNPDTPPLATVQPGASGCFALGPFADLDLLTAVREKLETGVPELRTRREMQQISGAYWVYLPSYPDRDAAREASRVLAASGIRDYFIINDDEERNGISLGLYSRKQGSEQRRMEIAKLGFKPLIKQRERQRELWWLDGRHERALQPDDWRVDGMDEAVTLAETPCSLTTEIADTAEEQ